MSRKRSDITNEQVERMLEDKTKYPTRQSVADALGCTMTLIRSVEQGKRTNPDPKKVKIEEVMCSCCNRNPVGYELRFLCQNCYRQKSHLNDIETTNGISSRVRSYNAGGKE